MGATRVEEGGGSTANSCQRPAGWRQRERERQQQKYLCRIERVQAINGNGKWVMGSIELASRSKSLKMHRTRTKCEQTSKAAAHNLHDVYCTWLWRLLQPKIERRAKGNGRINAAPKRTNERACQNAVSDESGLPHTCPHWVFFAVWRGLQLQINKKKGLKRYTCMDTSPCMYLHFLT